ncbi:hypothetical protein P3T76_015842 [Phytophthora citrophthora]|uniref:Uncharacterized protein n=1 Tax=Phytophthora citrophthora TaxID=4793 RepID=A0AAD9FYS9_9STRA|nr:hypothetical protein P3T76_015842 [Phytophthora citrophthora]
MDSTTTWFGFMSIGSKVARQQQWIEQQCKAILKLSSIFTKIVMKAAQLLPWMELPPTTTLHTVVWLHQNRSEGCTTAAMDGAATNGHLEMVKWLNENRTEGCTTAAMTESCEDTSPLQGGYSQQQR